MSRGPNEKAQSEQDASREDMGSRKGRGLLGAPSKGSSQQVQSSSAATGLSGATANEPRDSIGGHSKESRSSRLGRRRNGSIASNRSGLARTTTNAAASQQNSAASAPQKRKKGGLRALLGCCGVPDDANALEAGEDPLPPHKLDKIPQRPATSSRRTMTPSEQTTASKTQLQEKDKEAVPAAQPLATPAQDAAKAQPGPASTNEQPPATDRATDIRQPANVTVPGPSIAVNPPVTEAKEKEQASEKASQDVDGDVAMPDIETSAPTAAASPPAQEPANPADEQLAKPMPPPPPGPIPLASDLPISQGETSIASEESEPQKSLLPPIEPHLKGRKCLVLDLDETLVHSSFKVSIATPRLVNVDMLSVFRFSTRRTSRYRSKSRATTTMYTS